MHVILTVTLHVLIDGTLHVQVLNSNCSLLDLCALPAYRKLEWYNAQARVVSVDKLRARTLVVA
jgi:hypothetical protein